MGFSLAPPPQFHCQSGSDFPPSGFLSLPSPHPPALPLKKSWSIRTGSMHRKSLAIPPDQRTTRTTAVRPNNASQRWGEWASRALAGRRLGELILGPRLVGCQWRWVAVRKDRLTLFD